MTDFFTRMAEQTLKRAGIVHPLVPSRFAPGRALVGNTLSDSFKEAVSDGVEEQSHALSERGKPTDYSSLELTPLPVMKEGSCPVMPTRFRTETPHRAASDTEPLSDHVIKSRSQKEDQGIVSSSLIDAGSTAWSDNLSRTALDAGSVRRRRAGSDRREPIETLPSNNGIRSKNSEAFAQMTPVVHTKDLAARNHSTADLFGLSKPSIAEMHTGRFPHEAIDQIASSELPSSPPPIRVTIGRVEIRAIRPPSQPTQAKTARPRPTLSLEDYLKQRNGKKR